MKKRSNVLHVDFETRSQISLKEVGTVPYALHPSTHVLVAWINWRGKWHVFDPTRNRKVTRKLMEQVHEDGATISAYNWSFEYSIMRYCCTRLYGWPEFDPDRFECSRARSLRWGLPGSLGNDSVYLGTRPKDKEGHAIMLRLTKPRKPLKAEHDAGKADYVLFDQDPDKFAANSRYCKDDVKAEMDLERVVPPLSKLERRIFRLDQRTQVRGVAVDAKLCHGAIRISRRYEQSLLDSLPASAWRAFDTLGQHDKVRAYCIKHDPDIFLPNMLADTIVEALRTCTNKKVRKVLTARTTVGGQAVKKYAAALRMQHQGRLYFQLQYCGASATGRWSAIGGIQLQNMPRPVIKGYDENVVKMIRKGRYDALAEYASGLQTMQVGTQRPRQANVGDVLKSYSRTLIVPSPGALLAVNDYAAVEARKVFWYAGDDVGLDVFASGKDPYVWMAARIYDKAEEDITGDERFVGKQAVLGCGYGMGAARFCAQAAGYGQDVHISIGNKSVQTYRKTFRRVKQFWHDTEDACKELLDIGTTDVWFEVGKVRYRYDGVNVICQLPSGTELVYHRMRYDASDDQLYHYGKGPNGAMIERKIWGGTLVENICQASSRDLMADAMLRLDAHEFPNIMQVHDEMVNEIGHPDCMQEVQACIMKRPRWAKDFPLAIEGEVLDRYRKI